MYCQSFSPNPSFGITSLSANKPVISVVVFREVSVHNDFLDICFVPFYQFIIVTNTVVIFIVCNKVCTDIGPNESQIAYIRYTHVM